MTHHTEGERPLVLEPADLQRVEAVPLDRRDLPATTYELLARSAGRWAGAPALHLLGESGASWREPVTWTYAGLLAHVHQAASLYTSLGLRPGGAVGLLLPNTGWTYAALLGAQAVGIAAPVNPMLDEQHIADILAVTEAEVLVTAGPRLSPPVWGKALRVAERLPGIRAVLAIGAGEAPVDGRFRGDFARLAARQDAQALTTPHRRTAGDLAAYFHTGGTTGTPKIAPHTHAGEVYTAWALGCSGGFLDDSVALSGLPLFHVNAVHVTGLAPFLHGRPVVSLGPLGYRNERLMADFWQILAHYRVSSFSGVPTLYAALPPVPDDVDLSSLRAGAVGAAPLPRTIRTGFEAAAKVPLLEGYGLTEATCATSVTPALAPRAGSVGLRLPYQHVKAVQVDGTDTPTGDCRPGEIGVLAVKGPNVFPGYLRAGPDGPLPDPTGKIFDGWLVTGDLGWVDKDGYVHLTGRAKDLIIRGGHNIDPALVEEALLSHHDISGAAAVGSPDAHAGEVPVAYVTLVPGATATERELRQWAADHSPEPAAAPRSVHIVGTLPLTAVGKVFKPALADDALVRVVRAEMREAGLSGAITVHRDDGHPYARIEIPGTGGALAARLGRFAFAWSIAAADGTHQDTGNGRAEVPGPPHTPRHGERP
ncbi:acyl-CoA synthetase [Streptomyces sp. NBC_00687]|uniref:acyl-CoA synthetase n=1 Tax=Streptomyces sp. NBC_00687 TaxID=2975807 RepID=UPI0022501EB1|nr:acyl-CoA synthetase [Streptomyces sp. NBC_00687]MCX4919044.1 acyl-CoA synthetase [Streptomyces sp. NBC_00687]